jgi:queuosine precursor transporter
MLEGQAQPNSWLIKSWPVLAFAFIVLISNIAVQYPVEYAGLQDVLTWGAFTYPFAFLVTDLCNRQFGAERARFYVSVGFIFAIILSAYFATPRIALASGLAFLLAQFIDISIFERLRNKAWWQAPFLSSVVSSGIDTAVFFSIAFYCGALPASSLTVSDILMSFGIQDSCETLPWVSLAIADYLVKLGLAAMFIAPYGALSKWLPSHSRVSAKA